MDFGGFLLITFGVEFVAAGLVLGASYARPRGFRPAQILRPAPLVMLALAHGAKKENQERGDAPDPLKVTNGHSSQGTDQVSQKRLIAPTIPVQCVRLTLPYRLASCPSVSA